MVRQLNQQCIWISGASSGLGQALAHKLCAMGNFIIISGRNEKVLHEMSLTSRGRMQPMVMDLSGGDENLECYRKKLASITDYLDLVICCAGACEYENDLSFDVATYRRIFEVNFLGAIKMLNLAWPLLKRSEQKHPRVVLVGSLSSVVPFPRAEAYGASKAALQYLADSLRVDTANWPLEITLVRPGFVATPMTQTNDFAMPFIISAEEAADRIVHGIKANKKIIDFPYKLSLMLAIANRLRFLWLNWIAPKMSRHPAREWRN